LATAIDNFSSNLLLGIPAPSSKEARKLSTSPLVNKPSHIAF